MYKICISKHFGVKKTNQSVDIELNVVSDCLEQVKAFD